MNIPISNLHDRLRRAMTRLVMRQTGMLAGRGPITDSQTRLARSTGEVVRLPMTLGTQAQDLDPDSPTFGQFRAMMGYDSFGSAIF